MKQLVIALVAVAAFAACHKKEAEAPPQKPDEIRAVEKAKETAKKLNDKTKETNEVGHEVNDEKTDSTKSDSSTQP